MIQLPLIILACLWFIRRWQVSRLTFLVFTIVGYFLFCCLVQYRAITTERTGYASFLKGSKLPSIEEIEQIDPFANIKSTIQEGGPEVEVLIYYIHATNISKSYDLGTYHWNGLIHNFVPAQIFGSDFKQSLLISDPLEKLRRIYYKKNASTAMTGFADAYGSFWYFGCVKFFIIAYIMGRLYCNAMNGHFRSQLYYVCLLLSAMHAVPHSTHQFLRESIMLMIFTYPLLWLCRNKSRNSITHSERWLDSSFVQGMYYQNS